MAGILVIEDDELLNKGIVIALEKHKHAAESAFSWSGGFTAFLNRGFDLILLDINLPDGSGIQLCEEIRRKSQVPIIFITANDTEEDVVNGFKTGCDDYISKPFSLEVLNQRVQAVLRRLNTAGNTFRSGKIAVDYDKMLVTKSDEIIRLTATEYKLLTLLTKNNGQVLTRQTILEKLWDVDEAFVDENALSVNMGRLRRKIESDHRNPEYIKTVFGIGYTWGGVY